MDSGSLKLRITTMTKKKAASENEEGIGLEAEEGGKVSV